MRIPPEFVRQVRDRIDIVEVIGERVALRPAGSSFVGLCPFHAERTPSFSVSRERGRFHCFGCQKSGDCFDFVMQTQGLDFLDAVAHLAQRAGLSVPDQPMSSEQRRQRGQQQELLSAVAEAARFYRNALLGPEGGVTRTYLQGRGIRPATMEAFGLGYAPEAWDALYRALRPRFSPAVLERAGLVLARRQGEGYYDRFRNRLMYPICDERGRPVAFGARALTSDERAKYVNSPETEIWQKRRTLYPLHLAKAEAMGKRTYVLVEGYMDAITCHQHGFLHVVASLGTALSVEQAGILARGAETVILAYDADAAGQAATLRGMALLQEAGLAVSVARLTSGKDPDEMVRTEGEEAFGKALEGAQPLIRHLVAVTLGDRGAGYISPEGRWQSAEEIAPYLARLPAGTRNEYTEWVARQLMVQPGVLLGRVSELAKKDQGHSNRKEWNARNMPAAAQRGLIRSRGGAEAAEEIALAVLLQSRSALPQLTAKLSIHDFGGAAHQVLAKWLLATGGDEAAREVAAAAPPGEGVGDRARGEVLLDVLEDSEMRSLVVNLLELQVPGDPLAAAEAAFRRVHRGALERAVDRLKAEQRRLEAEGQGVGSQAMRDLLLKMTELQAELAWAADSARGLGGDG